MLRNFRNLKDYALRAVDGEIGQVRDLYFDDTDWKIRYLVANTGGWLTGRKVLISPVALGRPDARKRVVPVGLERDRIENSPPIAADRPVSRHHEMELARYYQWPAYWGPPASVPPVPDDVLGDVSAENPNLRSTDSICGYRIDCTDGETGHVEDFVIDDKEWAIQDVVVDTRNWFPGGKKVLLAPGKVRHLDARRRRVETTVDRQAVECLPGVSFPSHDPWIPTTDPAGSARAAQSKTEKRRADLQKVPGIGPRRVEALLRDLAVVSLPELERAARSGRLREIEGVGERTERKVLDYFAA